MSGFNSPQGASQHPKQMSSRLLTMKFMQRASASTNPTSPATPNSTISEPFSKKRKFDTSTQSPTTAPRVLTPGSNHRSFTSQHHPDTPQALSRTVSFPNGDETQWVLDYSPASTTSPDTKVMQDPDTSSFSESDNGQDNIWSNEPTGRQIYGNFKRRKHHQSKSAEDRDSNDEELSSLSDSDSDSTSEGDDSSSSSVPHQNGSRSSKPNPKTNSDRRSEKKSLSAHHQKSNHGKGQGQPGSLRELANRAALRDQAKKYGNSPSRKKKKSSRKTI